jgi:hypothetical protein
MTVPSLIGPVCMVTAAQTGDARRRANEMLDEMILMALVPGPLKTRELRAAVMPFGDHAVHCALARLMSIGEIVGEGLTVARVYRLVQRTATPSEPKQPRIIRADGVTYETVWPLQENPQAPPRVLCERSQVRR